MDNLGYKEGFARPKKAKIVRRDSKISGEDVPLFSVNQKYKINANTKLKIRIPDELELEMGDDAFGYMQCGPSPPAENIPSHMYDKFEESFADLNVQVCDESIRDSLLEQIRKNSGNSKLLDEIENRAVTPENAADSLSITSKFEANIAFLWSCFVKRHDLLEYLISVGADPNFIDANGISALHLAAFSGCVDSVQFLLSHDIDINLQPRTYTPLHFAAFGNAKETAKLLIKNGASIFISTNKLDCNESLLHLAVRANAIDCIELFIREGADVNSLKPSGTNPIHLAADLGLSESLKALLNSPTADANIRICFREKESTALHLAADEGNVECVNLLLAKGADAKIKNHRGVTPLHLAARTSSIECVESLLCNGNANPNAEDFDKRTPLHAAIGKSDTSLLIIESLIMWGADINQKDIFGYSALHLAAVEGFAQCVDTLIYYGADVTTRSRKGTTALNVIARKIPDSLAMIKNNLDSAISIHESEDPLNRDLELELDFRQLSQNCHPKEISFLHTFIEEGQKEFLEHPLCTAFLYIKWKKVRKFFIARLVFCLINVLFLSLYVLTALAHSCYNGSRDLNETIKDQELCQKQSIFGDLLRNNPFVIEMQWWTLVAITMFEITRKLYGLTGYSSFRHYVTQIENIIEWFVILSVFLTSYIYNKRIDYWQNHVAAFAVLLGWTNLMLMMGQLPDFGVYVAMYTKVQVEFGKLFMAYSGILIGFSISFCVIIPDSPIFSNPIMAFISVLVMMTGEEDLIILTNDPDRIDPPLLNEISGQVIYILFIVFVTVILMNLLEGIAVNDIEELKKTAELSRLVRQTELIHYIESALFKRYLPSWLRKIINNHALVSPQSYRAVLCVKPLNPDEKRLPKEILMQAYDLANERKGAVSTDLADGGFYSTEVLSTKDVKKSIDSGNELDVVNFNGLKTKIDDHAQKIEELHNEVQELKNNEHRQRTINQLMEFLNSQMFVD
ncbi:Transient receptor potential channel pyrexia [Pseudolycoriella hygida]|uniref:Transient receptor potential channel pyrexia n=1 Tax=Pseudolycoriella hygida TaxID=35572 RepID=A0A9Q0S645_9DIPT|nr:Transient receptor potential channel pyrexia [Pseudolycoriella hygida]